jgi:NAD(P)-dependent dehydrogenase (short-subunit alcohol dehydrogenase family)
VLVNNAGRTHVGAVEETSEEELRSLFDVHLLTNDFTGLYAERPVASAASFRACVFRSRIGLTGIRRRPRTAVHS